MPSKSAFLATILCALVNQIVYAQMPAINGTAHAPDAWLLERVGRPWWYRTSPSSRPVELKRREPNPQEQPLIDAAKNLMSTRPARALALVEGDSIVYLQFNAPTDDDSVIFGFSIGKTVTAMAVGQAVCEGKLKLDTKARDLIPELEKKALGNATVKDLLRMASGSTPVNSDSTIYTPQQARSAIQGTLNLLEVITEDRVAKAQQGYFSDYKPGEETNYKSTDPILLAMMTAKATGVPWSQWVQQVVLSPMGAVKTGLYVQDYLRNGMADSGLRIRMEDWIRFALWVKRSSLEQDCFGDFVRNAMKTQIKNGSSPADRKFGQSFGGYGYFTWTENIVAPNSVWAMGWGGQRIGWSTDPHNHRMVIIFSNTENWAQEVYALARDWFRLK